MAKLTERQRKFVLFYEGNATEAAVKAGYSAKSAYSMGVQLLKNIKVAQALKEKHAPVEAKHIADAEERREILTNIAKGEDERTAVKAIDVLNKMDAVYIQKQEITHNFQGKSKEEVIQMAIKELESLGYKVIPPKWRICQL